MPEPWEMTTKQEMAQDYLDAMDAKTAIARFNLKQATTALDRAMGKQDRTSLGDHMASLGEAATAVSAALTMLGSALQSAEGALTYSDPPPNQDRGRPHECEPDLGDVVPHPESWRKYSDKEQEPWVCQICGRLWTRYWTTEKVWRFKPAHHDKPDESVRNSPVPPVDDVIE